MASCFICGEILDSQTQCNVTFYSSKHKIDVNLPMCLQDYSKFKETTLNALMPDEYDYLSLGVLIDATCLCLDNARALLAYNDYLVFLDTMKNKMDTMKNKISKEAEQYGLIEEVKT